MSRLRLSVATKIALCFAVVLVTFASVGITSILSLHALGNDLGMVGESYLPLTKALAQIESLHKNKERDTDRVLHEHDRATERILVSNTRNYFGKMMQERVAGARAEVLRAETLAKLQDHAFLIDMDRRLQALSEHYGEYSAAAGQLYDDLGATSPNESAIVLSSAKLRSLESQAGREVSFLSTELEAQVAERVNQVHRSERRAAWVIIGLSLGAIALGLLATGLSQRLLLPIRTLTEEVRGISRGDFGRRVEIRAGDEVGVLAEEFNAMAASLRERERQLGEQRERLLQSERLAAIGKVSAQITHEIRNPLSSIGLNAELLADELQSAKFPREEQRAEAEALLSAIAKEIDRLTEISEQYLAFARPPRMPPTRIDVADLCHDLVDFVSPELGTGGVQVKLALADDLPRVVGHEDQLRQALVNLMRNAREAMPQGGTLTLQAAFAPDTGVTLSVADTGPGVPMETRERIFEPFFSTKKTGTGLGLALSRRIAQEHGGTLSLTPSAAGGACFQLILPRVATAGEEPAPSPPSRPAALA